MQYRTEHDSMGQVLVPSDKYWGAQTQRSFENFKISYEKMPREIIYAIALIKKAAAQANCELRPNKITPKKCELIINACDKILSGELDKHFPLSVWQTGSGTQTNMNVNEVVAGYSNLNGGTPSLHPNDDVNCSQSSNDVFPAAIHIATVLAVEQKLVPSIKRLESTLVGLEQKYTDIIKTGRTHLQDATPVTFSQEISGWRAMVSSACDMIVSSLDYMRPLALGGTATGTGLNSPVGFGKRAAELISQYTQSSFSECENKFYALTAKDAAVFVHGALNAYASNLWKIANDVRLLASGPRCGIGEINIPENEPGSSIMPGKVNPTQCEAVTMVAAQVQGNNTTISVCASQGNFQLNVFMPVIAYDLINSITLLCDVTDSFNTNCVMGITPNTERMKQNLDKSLMLVTALSPEIGYENAASVAKYAFKENMTLKDAAVHLGFITPERFDQIVDPSQMTSPK